MPPATKVGTAKLFSWWRDTVVERRPLAGELSLQLMDEPSATGQPTRPTQPFILSRSIN